MWDGRAIYSPGWRRRRINRDQNLRLQYLAGMSLNAAAGQDDLRTDAQLPQLPGGSVYRFAGFALRRCAMCWPTPWRPTEASCQNKPIILGCTWCVAFFGKENGRKEGE